MIDLQKFVDSLGPLSISKDDAAVALEAFRCEAIVETRMEIFHPDRPAHKVMTPEEYTEMPIIGWHEVCRNVDNAGAVGVRFITN